MRRWYIARIVDMLYWIECAWPYPRWAYRARHNAESWCIRATGKNIYGEPTPQWVGKRGKR